MTFCLVAFHHPHAEHREQMVQRVRDAAQVMTGVSGCLEAEVWQEESGEAIVGIGRWESREAWMRSLDAVAAADVDFDYDEREQRPRDVFNLVSAG